MKTIENNKESCCTICGHALQKRKPGWVCKNWNCPLYWKMGVGYVFQVMEDGYVIDGRLERIREWGIRAYEIYIAEGYTPEEIKKFKCLSIKDKKEQPAKELIT